MELTINNRQHRNPVRGLLMLVVALCLVLAANAWASPQQMGYVDHVSAALEALEAGKTQESTDALKLALSCNSNDPLAHAALGLTLLMGGYPNDADAEFALALKLDSNCAEATYGKGLVLLGNGDIGGATSLFCQAQAEGPSLDIKGTIEYAKALAGAAYTRADADTRDECLQALSARARMNDGRLADAAAVWAKLQTQAVRPGYGERIGCSMTFTKNAPLVVTGWHLKKAFRSIAPDDSKLPVVSGKVTLKADLRRAQSVSLVSFYVDNKLVGITNHEPFSHFWDTSSTANGPHTVRVQGTDTYGSTISEKTMHVMVRNSGPGTASQRDTSEGAAKTWQRLWSLMKLKPSAAFINSNLAQCALRQRDNASAEAALERVLAADPGSTAAMDQLAELYRKEGGYARLHRVAAPSKVIALTFDDGPKANTPELLDLLKQKGVKATFFVVGKQVETFPDILKRMAADGHDIENHTYLHRDLERLTNREIIQEIFQTSSVVRSLTGKSPRFLRPPGGHEGNKLPEVMRKFSMGTVFWTVNCGEDEGKTPKRMIQHVTAAVVPGAIVLMHNLEPVTLLALPEIIDMLKSQGYTFVTLSEVARTGA